MKNISTILVLILGLIQPLNSYKSPPQGSKVIVDVAHIMNVYQLTNEETGTTVGFTAKTCKGEFLIWTPKIEKTLEIVNFFQEHIDEPHPVRIFVVFHTIYGVVQLEPNRPFITATQALSPEELDKLKPVDPRKNWQNERKRKQEKTNELPEI